MKLKQKIVCIIYKILKCQECNNNLIQWFQSDQNLYNNFDTYKFIYNLKIAQFVVRNYNTHITTFVRFFHYNIYELTYKITLNFFKFYSRMN